MYTKTKRLKWIKWCSWNPLSFQWWSNFTLNDVLTDQIFCGYSVASFSSSFEKIGKQPNKSSSSFRLYKSGQFYLLENLRFRIYDITGITQHNQIFTFVLTGLPQINWRYRKINSGNTTKRERRFCFVFVLF